MEGRAHSSQSYTNAKQVSRMKDDLLKCSKDLNFTFQNRTTNQTGHRSKLKVGIVGAGLAGLRCAEILISEGVEVTILEARDRIGGRVSYYIRQIDGQFVSI
jgi:NADPH-dependent glutamate synthase beta subunit-like oxidoreductase